MGIVRWLVAALVGEPLKLPREVLERFPELAGARFRRGGLPPHMGGWALGQRSAAAVAVWRTVFVARDVAPHPELLLHELRHVHQFQESAAFPAAYLWECVRRGYRRNRFEVDAREWASARVRAAPPQSSPGKE